MAEAEKQGADPYVIMDQMAKGAGIGSSGLLYLPYLMGERSLHPDPDCRGVFFGLSAIHNRANLIRAVLEGVAYSQRQCVDIFREMGVQIDDMMACGGGRSKIWRQMLADLYGCPVSTLHTDGGPALGVALLAGVGAGIYGSVEEACDAVIRKGTVQQPDMQTHKAYKPYFELYKKLYLDLKDDFKRRSSLNR